MWRDLLEAKINKMKYINGGRFRFLGRYTTNPQ